MKIPQHKILLVITLLGRKGRVSKVQFFHHKLYVTPSGGHMTWNSFMDNEPHYVSEKDLAGYVYEFMFALYVRYGTDNVSFNVETRLGKLV